MSKTALIMAGGTGGHIIPGIALAQSLQEKGWKVYWLGNAQAMEGRLVPAQGIPLLQMYFQGFRGKGLWSQLKMPIHLLKALSQARKHLRQIRPDVVIGMGGYVAFPGGLMAKWLGIPLIIHEQNSVAGLTNKILARKATRVFTGFPAVLPKGVFIGNPLLKHFTNGAFAAKTSVPPLRLLVVGGSLGAQALNERIPAAFARLPAEQRPIIVHQAGEKHQEQLLQTYQQHGVQADVRAFITDMVAEYQAADVIICRAGAMTVAEVSALGVAALFVPFPHAVDDHQTTNASFLVEQNAAWLCQQSQLTEEWIVSWWNHLTSEELSQYRQRCYDLGKRDATETLRLACENLVKERKSEA